MSKRDDEYNELWRKYSGWDAPEGADHDDYDYDEENDRLVNINDPGVVIYGKASEEEDVIGGSCRNCFEYFEF